MMPKPKKDESLEDFVARACKDPFVIAEYTDEDSRMAAVKSMYKGEKTPETNMKAGDTVRANIRCVVNNKQIRHEMRDGRSVIVVPSYTLPDNIIMNGIMYPADEIEKSYKTLEGTPAPLGHPTVNNMFVPANSPLGLNIGYFGAWNATATKVDGRIFLEKIIDVERAQESKMGRRVLEALDAHKPIHTSTGLTLHLREAANSDLADYEAYDLQFDHDAILLDEAGAATPEQGVGMMVNGQKTVVVNSDLEMAQESYLDRVGMELLSAYDREEAVSRWARMKDAIKELLSSDRKTGSQPKLKEAEQMDYNNEDIKKMSEGIATLTETVNSLGDQMKDVAVQTAKNSEVVGQIEADRKSATDALVAEVVELELLNEADAKATPAAALQSLINSAKKTKPEKKPAAPLFAGFNGSDDKVSLAEDWEA